MPSSTLTPQTAKLALNEIYSRFNEPENKSRLVKLVEECGKAENPMLDKIQKFPAVVTDICKDLMQKYGYAEKEIMQGIVRVV